MILGLEALVDPARLPRPTSRVDVVETHLSWVLLADEDVYKLKKPVDLGFVDFTSREAREAACHAEVTLNRRLGGDVYLGVLPVHLGPDGPRLGAGAGPVVDHAVHMRRLPAERCANRLLAEGELGADDLARLAGELAAFHASARRDGTTDRFGLPEVIAVNVEENFAQAGEACAALVGPRVAGEVEAWQRAFLERETAILAARRASGRIRDGHGDLRLEHVYFLCSERRPVVVDCIEFNDRFRFGDVAGDVAFLAMDLAFHGRVDLAERWLGAYARASDDWDLYAVVDFYASYRAWVRGKIAVFGWLDPGAGHLGRERSRELARRYFLLAQAGQRPPVRAPILVTVGGPIASGKSTVGEGLGARLALPVVDADRTRKHLLGLDPQAMAGGPPFSGAYDPATTARTYAELLRRAEVVLRSGRGVVVDASFREQPWREAARSVAARVGVRHLHVRCSAPVDVLRARLAGRAGRSLVTDAREDLLEPFLAAWEPTPEGFVELVVDTSGDGAIEEVLAALAALAEGGRRMDVPGGTDG